MSVKTHLKGELTFRSSALPLPKPLCSAFVALVTKWHSCSGEEWTINRCKSIKLDLIRMRAGEQPVASWIRHGKKTRFSGVLAWMERLALSNDKNFQSVIQLTQVYTYFIAKDVTSAQMDKFLGGVLASPPRRLPLIAAKANIKAGLFLASIRKVRYMPKLKPILSMAASDSRRAPTLFGSKVEPSGVLDSIGFLFSNEAGYAHYLKHKAFYDPVLQGLDWLEGFKSGQLRYPYWMSEGPTPDFQVGSIGLIQEPGYKLRAVANPGRVFQRVLEPIGDTLYRLLRELPWDCTFDQSKGFPVIQESLRRGNSVHSVDLSGATDYFPLSLQLQVCEKIFGKQLTSLLEDISTAKWLLPKHGMIKWNRGQPLGLYPSFGLFALTHGLLLLGLAGSYKSQFFILGDDVVILDDELAAKYRSCLSSLGCPISQHKSLTSPKLAEFGGKLITSAGVIPQYKWRAVSDDSFLDIVRNYGHRAVKLLRSRQKSVVRYLADVPDCLGGFGWNPQGLPLEIRLQSHPWLWEPKEPNSRTTSYTGHSVQLLMESDYYNRAGHLSNFVTSIPEGLDQRSKALTAKYLGNFMLPWYTIAGKNIDAVLASRFLECDLPIDMVRVRSTMLTHWESIIRKVTVKVG